jgi:hypothetical protein
MYTSNDALSLFVASNGVLTALVYKPTDGVTKEKTLKQKTKKLGCCDGKILKVSVHCLDFMKMICLYKTNGPRKYYSGSDEFLTRSQEIVDKTSLFFPKGPRIF